MARLGHVLERVGDVLVEDDDDEAGAERAADGDVDAVRRPRRAGRQAEGPQARALPRRGAARLARGAAGAGG